MPHLQEQGLLLLGAFAVSVLSQTTVPPVSCTLKSPTPAGLTCGQHGTYGVESVRAHLGGDCCSATIGDQILVESLEQCRDSCARHASAQYNTGCLSFGYNSETNLCKLFTKTTAQKNFVGNNSVATVVYDYDCYDCPAVCPQPLLTQLLDNPGFEFSDTVAGPWYTYGNLEQTLVQPGHSSGTAWHCHVPQKKGLRDNCNIFQHVPACYDQGDPPGPRYYALAFDYRGVPAKGKSGPYHVPLYGFEFFANVSSKTAGTWHSVTSISRNISPGTTDRGFSVQCLDVVPQCAGDVYIDNAKVYAMSGDISTVEGAQSLVKNGGFETGVLSPWKLPQLSRGNKNVKLVKPGLKGSKHAILFHYTKAFPDFAIKQTIPTVSGTKYLFSVQYNASAGRNPFSVSLQIGQGEQVLTHNLYARGREQLVTLEHPFIAFEDNSVLSLLATAIGTGNVTFDNFSVREAVF